jgi:hypothetical protein
MEGQTFSKEKPRQTARPFGSTGWRQRSQFRRCPGDSGFSLGLFAASEAFPEQPVLRQAALVRRETFASCRAIATDENTSSQSTLRF